MGTAARIRTGMLGRFRTVWRRALLASRWIDRRRKIVPLWICVGTLAVPVAVALWLDGEAQTLGWIVSAWALAVLLIRVFLTWGWAQLVTTVAVGALLISLDIEGDGARWAGVAVLIGVVLSAMARRFSKTTFRAATAIGLLVLVGLVANQGIVEAEKQARETAEELLEGDGGSVLTEVDSTVSGGECADDVRGERCLYEVRSAIAAARAQELDNAKLLRSGAEILALQDAANEIRAAKLRGVQVDGLTEVGDALNSAAADSELPTVRLALGQAADAIAALSELDADGLSDAVRTARLDTAAGAVEQAQTAAIAAVDSSVTRAEAALEKAQTSLEQTPEPPVELAVVELIRTGADALVSRTVAALTGNADVAAQLGDVGWLVLLALATLGYRRLEARNNLSYGAPVTIDAEGDQVGFVVEGDLDAKFVRSALMSRLGSSELVQPPGTPGAASVDTIATTLKDSEVKGGKVASALLGLAQNTAFPPAGVVIRGTVQIPKAANGASEGAPGDDGEAKASERPKAVLSMHTARVQKFIRTETFVGTKGFDDMLDDAAAMIAADVLAYSSWTPSWSRSWGPRGASLRAYRQALSAKKSEIAPLEKAAKEAPGNGLIRQILAHAYDIDGRRLRALLLNIENRIDHPRLPVSRYRLAASLSMLAGTEQWAEHWRIAENRKGGAEARDMRRAVLSHMARDQLLLGPSATELWRRLGLRSAPEELDAMVDAERGPIARARAQDDRMRVVFLCWARFEARQAARPHTVPVAMFRAVRQEERMLWLGVVRSSQRRRRDHNKAETMSAIVDARLAAFTPLPEAVDPSVPNELRNSAKRVVHKRTERNRADAPALYNGACYWSIRAERDTNAEDLRKRYRTRSLHLLDESLRRGMMSAEWLNEDPDLREVREGDDADTRAAFKSMVKRLAMDG